MTTRVAETKSRLRSLVWSCLRRNRWRDDDDFSLRFADELFEVMAQSEPTAEAIRSRVAHLRTNFFTLNRVSRSDFLHAIEEEVLPHLQGMFASSSATAVLPRDIFPEIDTVPIEVQPPGDKLDIPERQIQDFLRKILRAKGASPVPFRGRDSALEVADIEHFRFPLGGRRASFAIVVKGFRSIPAQKLRWEDVAHQITKAFRTKPDYILLVSAKEPVDGLVTQFQEYAGSVGNPHLIVFFGPADLLRLLAAHRQL